MTVSNELVDRLLADYKKPEYPIWENGLLKPLSKRLRYSVRLKSRWLRTLVAATRGLWPTPGATPEMGGARRRSRATCIDPVKICTGVIFERKHW